MDKELETWALEFWGRWNKRWFTSTCKGSRAEAIQAIMKLSPDQSLRDKMDWYQHELQLRYMKMSKQDINTPWLKHVCRLVSKRFWDDELPDTRVEQQESVLAVCECGKPVKINRWCDECWDARRKDTPWQDRFMQLSVEHGHDKAVSALRKRHGSISCKNGVVERATVGTA